MDDIGAGDVAGAWEPPVIQKHTTKVQPKPGQGRKHFGGDYLSRHSQKHMPEDMREIVGSPVQALDVDEHVFDQMIPGARHAETTWYVENLDLVLARWEWWTPSPVPSALQRFEFYTPVGEDMAGEDLWYLVILEKGGPNQQAKVISSYPIRDTSVQHRINSQKRQMQKRGDEARTPG